MKIGQMIVKLKERDNQKHTHTRINRTWRS